MDVSRFMDKRVLIKPLNELGTVVSHHNDEREEPVIVVARDSDGQRHCCRTFEVEIQMTSDEIDDGNFDDLEFNSEVGRYS